VNGSSACLSEELDGVRARLRRAGERGVVVGGRRGTTASGVDELRRVSTDSDDDGVRMRMVWRRASRRRAVVLLCWQTGVLDVGRSSDEVLRGRLGSGDEWRGRERGGSSGRERERTRRSIYRQERGGREKKQRS
jgi:hypothetical protein